MNSMPSPDFRFSLWRGALLCFVLALSTSLLPASFEGVRHVGDQVGLLAASAWFIRRRGIASADITAALPSWRVVARWLGIGTALTASMFACTLMVVLLGMEPNDSSSPLEALAAFPVQMLVVVCVVAPLTEELAFRGLLLRNLMQRVSLRRAVLLSALVFAAVHMQDFGIAQFPMGLLLALAYVTTRSLWLSVAMHAAMNGLMIGLIYVGVAVPGIDSPAVSDFFMHLPHGPLWVGIVLIVGTWIVLFTRWLRALSPQGPVADEPAALPQPA